MKSQITMSDVAKQAEVTKTTVSLVFRNKPGVSENTRQRILDIARELGYRPSPNHQRRGQVYHGQIGILFLNENEVKIGVDPGGDYLLKILNGARQQAEQSGTGISFASAAYKQIADGHIPVALKRVGIDGLLIRGECPLKLRRWLDQQQIHYVELDGQWMLDTDSYEGAEQPETSRYSKVRIDNYHAMELVVDHLVENGCSKFATITGQLSHLNSRERLGGLYAALMQHGLSLDELCVATEKGFDESSGRRGVNNLVNREVDFDALVCQNDLIASGAIQQLREVGLSVPEDVKVIGFDNMSFASMLPVPLTSIDPHPSEIGRRGAELLLEQIDSGLSRNLSVRVATELVIRESSRTTTKISSGIYETVL